MIAVVAADHKGPRVIDFYDDDQVAEAQAMAGVRRGQGFAVTVIDAADLRDLCSVLPDRLQARAV